MASNSGSSASCSQVALTGSFAGFVDGVVKGINAGASAWTEKRVREREDRSKLASPGSRPSLEKKVKAEQLDAECRDICVPLVVDMMSVGMNAAGVHLQENQRRTEERMLKIEQSSNDLDQRASTLENSNCELDLKIDKLAERTQKLELENKALREKLDSQSPHVPQPVDNSAQPPPAVPAAARSAVPVRERTVARMANLGWDTPKDSLESRAREILTNAGVSDEQFKQVIALRDPGSAVEIEFHTAIELRRARLLVEALNKKYEECRSNVWMAAAKTDQELYPGRVCGRLRKVLSEFEKDRVDPLEVTQEKFLTVIKLGPTRAASVSSQGEVTWLEGARQRYSAEDLAIFNDFVRK